MEHADSKLPGTPTHTYLLHMDSSINLSPNEQALPLHLLDNSLEYGCKQYLLPIPSMQRQGQDHLQVLIDSSQGSPQILGLIDKKYQNIQNLPATDELEKSTTLKYRNNEEVSLQFTTSCIIKSESNIDTEELMNSTQTIKNYVHISDRTVLPRAIAVLPTILQIQRRDVISTRRTLPMRARFGPVQGVKHKISYSDAVELVLNATSNKKPLFLVKDSNDTITHIDTSDKEKANWISLLPLGDQNSANVWVYEEGQELYGITTQILPSRTPLLIGYTKKYADTYGLIGPTKDINKDSHLHPTWWCYICQQALSSAKHHKTHMDLYHKVDKVIRRRYRCRHCSRTFSRLFTLRRHTTRNCPVQLEKRNSILSSAPVEDEINLNQSIIPEDNRISSDESFQNYSNGLDFPTNLFDTDRISSLDISGNSRSDNDFNPYVLAFRDENCLTNDLDLSIKPEAVQSPPKEKQEKPEAPCPYCNQIVTKGKIRQHMRKCPGRQMKCECNKVFTNIKQFTDHVWTQHSNEKSSKKEDNLQEKTESAAINSSNQDGLSQYKCDTCQLTFKRRGMLVNHLWRVHNTVAARVPLERRVRHYPCGACPKLYRTASKRNRHVQKHHPGAVKVSGQALEGGTRVCEPAMCSVCPRQYATRAKLLQHQRAQHPDLIPPAQKNTKKSKSSQIVK